MSGDQELGVTIVPTGSAIALPEGWDFRPAEPLTLYEIVTTALGESYVRSYAWCRSEAEAREMFAALASGYEIHSVHEHFSVHSRPFITKPSDSGFDEEQIEKA